MRTESGHRIILRASARVMMGVSTNSGTAVTRSPFLVVIMNLVCLAAHYATALRKSARAFSMAVV
jgi:hypothetical protein